MKSKYAIFFLFLCSLLLVPSFADSSPEESETMHEMDRCLSLLQEDPRDARIHNDLGFAQYRLNHLEEARASLSLAVIYDPGYAVAYNNLGVVLLNMKEYRKAEDAFAMAIDLAPNYVKAAYNRAVALYRQGRYIDAFQAYRRAKRIDREYVRNRFEASNAKEVIDRKVEQESPGSDPRIVQRMLDAE
jgi:tetratricopeptide (TPR) repeat protein